MLMRSWGGGVPAWGMCGAGVNRRSLAIQCAQLGVLSGVHFVADMLGNMLPAILPEIRRHFVLSLTLGSVVLAALMLTANGVQMLTGQLRPDKDRPVFTYIGLVLAAAVCLLALAPVSTLGIAMVIGLSAISGCGIAVTHPEGLRGVHALDKIPPAISTAVFMTAGFLGFANGGAIAGALVDKYGLPGIYVLALLPVLGIAAMSVARIRLAVEPEQVVSDVPVTRATRKLPFWLIMAIGIPAATSTTVLLSLLPTHLSGMGYNLKFGGLTTAMFGWGATVGPFVLAAIAHRKGELLCSAVAFLASVPFMVFYLFTLEGKPVMYLLFGVGFFMMSGYILTITLARRATGPNLGLRMAWIVGGNWGVANLIFMAIAPLADNFGTGIVLKFTPAGYFISGLVAVWALVQYPAMRGRHRG